jgi:cobalt/nickel transport system ATP-binding protein
VVLSDGVIAADGTTLEILRNTELLNKHRLELPIGFNL